MHHFFFKHTIFLSKLHNNKILRGIIILLNFCAKKGPFFHDFSFKSTCLLLHFSYISKKGLKSIYNRNEIYYALVWKHISFWHFPKNKTKLKTLMIGAIFAITFVYFIQNAKWPNTIFYLFLFCLFSPKNNFFSIHSER